MEEKKEGKKKKGLKLTVRILLVAILAPIVVGIGVSMYAAISLSGGMEDEVLQGLGNLAQSIDTAYCNIGDGEYSVNDDGDLIKGDLNITKDDALIDSYVKGNDCVITVFYGDVRRATTIKDASGKRIVGTKADSQIANDVLKNGKTVEKTNATINGSKYYACYKPLKSDDGSIVGMVFAGVPAKDVQAYIIKKSLSMNIVTVIMVVAVCVISIMVVHSMKKGINAANATIAEIASGNLTTTVDEDSLSRPDELGDMIRGVEKLRKELLDVMESIHSASRHMLDTGTQLSDMAAQTSSTADEISHAVEDISKGAVSQAEEIETASGKIEQMGQYIGYTVDGVEELDKSSRNMKNASRESEVIIGDLDQSNDKTMDAIDRISRQVVATNDSANKISEAVDLISAIAEETNLLSLNASIEAARAGEQGKGFAVVANQIQKLAEQSNESAGTIADIIEVLLRDSETTVTIMQEVQKNVNEQKAKLDNTKKQFDKLGKGIDVTQDETENIKGHTNRCNTARSVIVDTFSSLSAISEENAASTEETTASMQELNATINILAEEADKLQGLSKELDDSVQFFKV